MLFSALLLMASAHAFTLMPAASTSNARWRDFPIRFSVNASHSPLSEGDLRAVLSDALSLWNGVPSSKLRAEVGNRTSIEAKNLITDSATETAVVFDENFFQDLQISDHAVVAVGAAVSHGDSYTRGFIIVNANAMAVRNPDELRVILAHEAGHAFGLGHTEEQAALMYPYVQRIERLGDDDASGITFLYPEKEGLDGMPFGCGSIQSHNDQDDQKMARVALSAFWILAFASVWRLWRYKLKPKAAQVSRLFL
jgi:hypothetical protein